MDLIYVVAVFMKLEKILDLKDLNKKNNKIKNTVKNYG